MKMDAKRFCAGVVVACALVSSGTAANAADKVLMSLNWIPGGNHVGFYLAKEQGFYTAEGLDVEIQRGYGSGDTVKRIATGAAQVGIADSASVLVGRGNGMKVKQIAALFSHSADALFFLEGRGISKPKDLEGRSVGGTTGETTLNLLPVFATKAGFDMAKVNVINLAGPAKPSSLASKTVDALVGFVNEEPGFRTAVEKAGEKIAKFKLSDFGIDYYSIGLIATDDLIAQKPDLLKRFVRATMKGYVAAIKNPEQGVSALVKALPEVNPAVIRQQFEVAKPLMISADAKTQGIGWIDQGRMVETINLIKSYQKVEGGITPNDIYTMSVFEKVPLD